MVDVQSTMFDVQSTMFDESEIIYKIAWKKDDEKIIKDACDLWKEMGALKDPEAGKARAKSLCVVAYHGETLVAVSTVFASMLQQVYSRVFFFRCVVRPKYRRRNIATKMAMRCDTITEEWSQQNPAAKAMAFVIRVETNALTMKCYEPIWNKKLNFMGYSNEGLPLYIRWYPHSYFGDDQDNDYTFYPSRPGALGRM